VWTGVRRGLIGLGLLALAAASVPASIVLPLVRDDLALDRIVVAVALDWRDFGATTAQQRLQYELDHHAIGSHVGDDDCALSVEADRVRRVHCQWRVQVKLIGMEEPYPMEFMSTARVDRNGVLLR
jgi:hypothetical protein